MRRNFRLRFTYLSHGDAGRYVSARFKQPGQRLGLDLLAQTEDPVVSAVRADDQLGERNRLFDELVAVGDRGGDAVQAGCDRRRVGTG